MLIHALCMLSGVLSDVAVYACFGDAKHTMWPVDPEAAQMRNCHHDQSGIFA